MLLSQRQDFLNNHLARVPITPNQEGTLEMRDEVLSSVGAQDLDTSSYQVSDLEDIEFNWQDSQLDMDAVFRLGIDTPFSPTTFNDLLMGNDQLKTPLYRMKRMTRKMLLLQQHPNLRNLPGCREVELVEQEWKLYPILFIEIRFVKYYCVCVLIKFIINVFHFIINFFKN